MYYEKESGSTNFLAGVLVGAVLGVSIAMLTAPRAGRRTRQQILRAVHDVRDVAEDRWADLGLDMKAALRRRRRRAGRQEER